MCVGVCKWGEGSNVRGQLISWVATLIFSYLCNTFVWVYHPRTMIIPQIVFRSLFLSSIWYLIINYSKQKKMQRLTTIDKSEMAVGVMFKLNAPNFFLFPLDYQLNECYFRLQNFCYVTLPTCIKI